MKNLTLTIECEYDAAERLSAALTQTAQSSVTSAVKDNNDGSLPTILQLVQVATSLAAALTPIIKSYIDSKKVKKIKFGEIEIEDPTGEQWEKLWNEYLSRQVTVSPKEDAAPPKA